MKIWGIVSLPGKISNLHPFTVQDGSQEEKDRILSICSLWISITTERFSTLPAGVIFCCSHDVGWGLPINTFIFTA